MVVEIELVLKNKLGLHARPASLLAQTASRFEADVKLRRSDAAAVVDASSVLGLLTLGAPCGTRLLVSADGPDADEALEAIEELIRSGFNE